jgi:hypothetical protein
MGSGRCEGREKERERRGGEKKKERGRRCTFIGTINTNIIPTPERKRTRNAID